MFYSHSFEDVGVVSDWHSGAEEYIEKMYKESVIPKTPLLIASIVEIDALAYKKVLDKNDWKLVCWYPSCHGPMTGLGSYNIHLYAKKQKAPKNEKILMAAQGVFPLACSVHTWDRFAKNLNPYDLSGLLGYPHAVIGLRRVDIKEEVDEKEVAPWFKFATTKLATYWAWGLKPGEKNVYALEPEIRALEKKKEEERKAAQVAYEEAQRRGGRASRYPRL